MIHLKWGIKEGVDEGGGSMRMKNISLSCEKCKVDGKRWRRGDRQMAAILMCEKCKREKRNYPLICAYIQFWG